MRKRKKQSHIGRPWSKPKNGQPAMMGFRVSPQIKRKLMKAAHLHGRSLSSEITIRLEKSFR